MLAIDIQTQPFDVIRAGTIFEMREGQTVIKSPMEIEAGAELLFPENTCSLVLEN